MPIRVQNDLPVKEILEQENIFVMDEFRAAHQDIRPISIGLLNLMPLKEDTELQILRALSNTPLQVDVTFVRVTSHVSKNTSTSHIYKFYEAFEDIKNKKFDGFIITGAPVEQMPFEDVDYWEELKGIMEWTKTNVVSTLHLCWGAQAGIYYHYGIDKVLLPEKRSGLYWHRVETVRFRSGEGLTICSLHHIQDIQKFRRIFWRQMNVSQSWLIQTRRECICVWHRMVVRSLSWDILSTTG